MYLDQYRVNGVAGGRKVAENPLPTRVTPRLAASLRQELPKGGWSQREGGHSPCAPSTPASLNYAWQMIDKAVTTWRQYHNLESFCSVDEATHSSKDLELGRAGVRTWAPWTSVQQSSHATFLPRENFTSLQNQLQQ